MGGVWSKFTSEAPREHNGFVIHSFIHLYLLEVTYMGLHEACPAVQVVSIILKLRIDRHHNKAVQEGYGLTSG